MVDSVNAGDCIESSVGKWQLLCRIRNQKFSESGQAALGCNRACCRNSLLMNVNPHDGTAGKGSHAQRGTTSSAGNIEEVLTWRKVEPGQELVLLVCGEPTILSNVLAKGFAPDLLV